MWGIPVLPNELLQTVVRVVWWGDSRILQRKAMLARHDVRDEFVMESLKTVKADGIIPRLYELMGLGKCAWIVKNLGVVNSVKKVFRIGCVIGTG